MHPRRIEQLRDPSIFPDASATEPVEIVQTHLSVVCLVGNSAYKFKKAIRLPFADFSTPEKRKHFCEIELLLNRRLCPDHYRSVETLREEPGGRLRLGEASSGNIVDYAVRMKRLPSGRMLDTLLDRNAVTREDVEVIASKVAAFHREAERGPEVAQWGSPGNLREFAGNNFIETREATAAGVFHPPLHAALEARTRSDFERNEGQLLARAEEGHIVDGHGDLHARNICLTDPVAIYDCLEFSSSLRCGDTANEHAFLLMDLRFRGHPELADSYLEAVLSETGDDGMASLMPMLIRYRAMVRAKVASIAAGESEMSAKERTESIDTARKYLQLAAATAVEEDGPWWLMLCGLPGSGKSFLSRLLQEASSGSWPVISSDHLRKELAGVPPNEKLSGEFYTKQFSNKTYAELLRRAAVSTGPSSVTILDANFRDPAQREQARKVAAESGARLAILHLDPPAATIESRLAARAGEGESDADLEVYRKLRSTFEVPHPGEADLLLSLTDTGSGAELVERVLTALLDR